MTRKTDIKMKGYLERAEVNSREWDRMTADRDGWKRLVEKVEQT